MRLAALNNGEKSLVAPEFKKKKKKNVEKSKKARLGNIKQAGKNGCCYILGQNVFTFKQEENSSTGFSELTTHFLVATKYLWKEFSHILLAL